MYIRVDELSGADRVLLYGLVLERLRALRVPLSARDLVARPPPPSPPPASPLASPATGAHAAAGAQGTLFGNSLESLACSEFAGCGLIPQFLAAAFEALSQHTDAEGLFRKAGSLTRQRELREALERHEPVDLSAAELVHDAAALLKQFLRELPEPLLTTHLQDAFLKAASASADAATAPDTCSTASDAVLLVCALLPPLQLACVRALVRFLRRVHLNAHVNRMDATNLAMLLAPNLFPKQSSGSTSPPPERFGARAPAFGALVSNPAAEQQPVVLRSVRTATTTSSRRPAVSRGPLLPNTQLLDLLPTKRPASVVGPELYVEEQQPPLQSSSSLSHIICSETSTARLQARVLELLILRAEEVGLVPADLQTRFAALAQHSSFSDAVSAASAPIFTAAEVNANSTLTSFEPNSSFTSSCAPLDSNGDLRASQLSLCAPPFESTRLDGDFRFRAPPVAAPVAFYRSANPTAFPAIACAETALEPNAVPTFTLPEVYRKSSRRSFGAYFSRKSSSNANSKSKKRLSIASSPADSSAVTASPEKKKRRSIQGLLIEFGHTISKGIRRASLGRLKEKAVAELDVVTAPADAEKHEQLTRPTLLATRRQRSLQNLHVNIVPESAGLRLEPEVEELPAPAPVFTPLLRQPIAQKRSAPVPPPTPEVQLRAPLATPERTFTLPGRQPAAAGPRGCVAPVLHATARGIAAQTDALQHQQQVLLQGPRVGPLEVLPSRCRISLLTEHTLHAYR